MNTKQQITYTLFGVLLVLVGHTLSEFVSEAIAQNPVWEQTKGPMAGISKT